MRPVAFEKGLLAPLPKHLQGSACCKCDRRQAGWHLRADNLNPVCSLCVLYEVDWAGKDPAHLNEYIRQVEIAKATTFARADDGHLVNIKDADAIIMGLVMVERLGPAIGR